MITDEKQCGTGPTLLFPHVKQCERKPVQYIFGVAYCRECYAKLIELHRKMSRTAILLIGLFAARGLYAAPMQYSYHPASSPASLAEPGLGGTSFSTGSLSHQGNLSISMRDLLGQALSIPGGTLSYATFVDLGVGTLSYELVSPATIHGDWESEQMLYLSGGSPVFRDGDAVTLYLSGPGSVPEPETFYLAVIAVVLFVSLWVIGRNYTPPSYDD